MSESGYAVFCGLDVGKIAHHAVALDPVGARLHDAPLRTSSWPSSTLREHGWLGIHPSRETGSHFAHLGRSEMGQTRPLSLGV